MSDFARSLRQGLVKTFTLVSAVAFVGTHAAHALTYVAGSLTDSNATNGNGVSSPSGAANIQYSDGSGSTSNYGQIDIADDPADPDWVYDQGSAQAVNSIAFWSLGSTGTVSQMPAGTITIYGASSSGGSWTQIGQVTRSMVRDSTLPINQAVAGQGFRVPCNGSSYRYLRINVVTPSSTGGLDNHWLIRKVEANPPIVVQQFYRASDKSNVLNDLPRIPYNIVDSNTATMWNPQATDMYLTLDLSSTTRRFQQIILTPSSGEAEYLPQKGEVRVSSNDDPDNMDTVVGVFNISYNNLHTDGATIILPQPFKKRYVQLHWNSVRDNTKTETRIAEVFVDTVADKPAGQDLTSLAIDPSYMVVPSSISDATTNTTHLNAALAHYKYVYLPQGTYYFDGVIYMPTDSRLYGYSDDTTILTMTNGSAGIRVEGSDFARLDHFRIDRMVNDATEAAIYVYKSGTDVPFYTEIDNVKITSNRSRAGSIILSSAVTAGVTNCSIYDSQAIFWDNNGGSTSYHYIWGSGISAGLSQNLYLDHNHVEETRNMLSTGTYSLTGRPPNHDDIQAGGIEPAGTRFAVVTNNYVKRYGVAIDINGAKEAWVQSNTSTYNNNSGVKMCNATNYCTVLNNSLDRCGIVGLWLAPGGNDGNVEYNLVTTNTVTNSGQGINSGGTDWNGSGYMAGSVAPAGILIQSATSLSSRVQYNTVTSNLVSGTSAIKSPASTYAIYTDTTSAPVPPYGNTVSSNTIAP